LPALGDADGNGPSLARRSPRQRGLDATVEVALAKAKKLTSRTTSIS
jgi:hypothetical protein